MGRTRTVMIGTDDGSYTLIDSDIKPTGGCWLAPSKPTSSDWLLVLRANPPARHVK